MTFDAHPVCLCYVTSLTIICISNFPIVPVNCLVVLCVILRINCLLVPFVCLGSLLVLFNIIDKYMHSELPYCSCKLLGCCQCCFAIPLFAGGLCYRFMTSLFHTHHLGKLLTIWCFHDKLCVPIDCCHLYRKVLLHWIAYASYVIFVPVHIV